MVMYVRRCCESRATPTSVTSTLLGFSCGSWSHTTCPTVASLKHRSSWRLGRRMDWLVYNTLAGFVLRGSAVIVASPQRPEIPDSCPLDLKKLIVDCWQEDRTVIIILV